MGFYPKAIRKIVARHDTPRTRDRGICHHVAASEGTSLFSYFNQSGNPTSHFYVRKDGTVEQYVDTRYQAPAQLAGNHDMISIETAGGLSDRTADREPWSEAQVASLIALDAWICATHKGIPLKMMPDSKSTSKGFGYHRLGIDPYRVAGGEVWSSSRGKVCPGLEKIDQIKTVILPGVIKLLGSTDTTPEDELSAAEVTDLKAFIEARTKAYANFDAKNLEQQLRTLFTNLEGLEQKYAVAVNNYAAQVDATNDASIAALTTKVDALAAAVAKLPKAV